MLERQYELKQLIDENGLVPDSLKEDAEQQEAIALEVMEYFLGCSIRVGGKQFVLSNLELYFGGIGDMAHDWYRSSFPERYSVKSRHSTVNTKAQVSKGPVYYFNQKGNGRFKRCDIVVGNEGVAASFLIRNVLNDDLEPVGTPNGQPNKVQKEMGLTDNDHLQPVELIDTRARVMNAGFKVLKKKRFTSGKFDGFAYSECPYSGALWNYSLVRDSKVNQRKDRLDHYTKEEIEDLKLKFSSYPF